MRLLRDICFFSRTPSRRSTRLCSDKHGQGMETKTLRDVCSITRCPSAIAEKTSQLREQPVHTRHVFTRTHAQDTPLLATTTEGEQEKTDTIDWFHHKCHSNPQWRSQTNRRRSQPSPDASTHYRRRAHVQKATCRFIKQSKPQLECTLLYIIS